MKNITAQIETDLKNWRGKFLVIINLLDFGIKKIGISNKKAIPKRADNKACLGTSVIVLDIYLLINPKTTSADEHA